MRAATCSHLTLPITTFIASAAARKWQARADVPAGDQAYVVPLE